MDYIGQRNWDRRLGLMKTVLESQPDSIAGT
jgi:hypothetical protein